MQEKPIRKQNRLDGYDYSSVGAYFVTICTQDRKQLFWARGDAEISTSPAGSVSFGSCSESRNLQEPVKSVSFGSCGENKNLQEPAGSVSFGSRGENKNLQEPVGATCVSSAEIISAVRYWHAGL